MIYAREDIEAQWYHEYFPSTRAWMDASHPSVAELVAHLPGARRLPVTFTDLEDGSLAALSAFPEKVLDPAWRRQTSYFERLGRDHAEELRAGLERLERELGAGGGPTSAGGGSVLAWTKPEDGAGG
jgi:hypothetical protein